MLTVLSSECSTEGAWDNFCRDRVHSSHLGFASIRYMWASILSLNCKNNIILFCTIIVSFWQSPMAGPPISTSSNSSLNQEMKAICFFWVNQQQLPWIHNQEWQSTVTWTGRCWSRTCSNRTCTSPLVLPLDSSLTGHTWNYIYHCSVIGQEWSLANTI